MDKKIPILIKVIICLACGEKDFVHSSCNQDECGNCASMNLTTEHYKLIIDERSLK